MLTVLILPSNNNKKTKKRGDLGCSCILFRWITALEGVVQFVSNEKHCLQKLRFYV